MSKAKEGGEILILEIRGGKASGGGKLLTAFKDVVCANSRRVRGL